MLIKKDILLYSNYSKDRVSTSCQGLLASVCVYYLLPQQQQKQQHQQKSFRKRKTYNNQISSPCNPRSKTTITEPMFKLIWVCDKSCENDIKVSCVSIYIQIILLDSVPWYLPARDLYSLTTAQRMIVCFWYDGLHRRRIMVPRKKILKLI